jgi:hypothetical protein
MNSIIYKPKLFLYDIFDVSLSLNTKAMAAWQRLDGDNTNSSINLSKMTGTNFVVYFLFLVFGADLYYNVWCEVKGRSGRKKHI